MAVLDYYNVKEELCVFLRNQDVLTTTQRGVTTSSDSFVATAGQTIFTLSRKTVKNVRSVTINAATKTRYTDYTVNYQDSSPSSYPTVTLTTGATVGDAVVVSYDYGTSDKIFPDMPRADLHLNDYPRVGIDVISGTTEPFGLGALANKTELLVSVPAWSSSVVQLENLQSSIRSKVFSNKKSFYYFNLMELSTLSPLIVARDRSDRLFQRTQDFRLLNIVEH